MLPSKVYIAFPQKPEDWHPITLNHHLKLSESYFFQFQDIEQCELYIEETGLIEFMAYPLLKTFPPKHIKE